MDFAHVPSHDLRSGPVIIGFPLRQNVGTYCTGLVDLVPPSLDFTLLRNKRSLAGPSSMPAVMTSKEANLGCSLLKLQNMNRDG